MGKNTLDFDSQEFEKRMALYGERAEAAARSALLANAKDLEWRAKDTCPYDEGTLEGDIKVNPQVKRTIDGFEAEVHAGTGESRNYALRMHESMLPAIPSGDKQFHPGPGTETKPTQPWGYAGGKYLTRPLMYKMKEYTKSIADKLAAVK